MAVTVDFQNLLNSVANYYGSGSDQWAEIYKHGLSSDDAYSILNQVPGVNLVLNKDGTVRDYSLSATGSYSTAGTDLAAQINSNVQSGTVSAAEAAQLNIPVVTQTATTGKLSGLSGIGLAKDTGLTVTGVLGSVTTGLMAVSSGIAVGQAIDKVLYDANPEFWDSHNMGTLNPDTWNSIIEADDNSIGANIVRAFFHVGGTDTDKNASMYIDENALAYATAYMGSQGVFNITNSKNLTDTTDLYFPTLYNMPVTYNDGASAGSYGMSGSWLYIKRDYVISSQSGSYLYSVPCHKPNVIDLDMFFISDDDFVLTKTTSFYDKPDVLDHRQVEELSSNSIINKNIKVAFLNDGTGNVNAYYYDKSVNQLTSNIPAYSQAAWDLNYIIKYGTTTTFSGVTGITPASGATGFNASGITDWSNIDSVLNALKTQYPSLFASEVSKDVPQADGATKTYNYVEVPIGQAASETDNQPVSGTSTQRAPAVDTSASTELQELLKTLLGTTTYNNPPSDTGSGDTPPVVIPTGSAAALYTVYNPTQAQLSSFGAWLWSADFVDQIKKLFNDPMQSIIGLHKIFCTPTVSGSSNIKVGYLDSGVTSNVVSNQYNTLSCGSIDLAEYFGNVFDYSPYTEVSLYLPFVGIVRLNVADVMRATLTVTYHFDVLTGACLVEVKVTRDSHDAVIYQYTGNAAAQYPLSSGSYMGILSGILSIAGGIAGTVATGGAAAPLLIGSAASALSMKTKVERSGSLSGNSGAMGIKIPYLIINRPQAALADNYQNYIGIPTNQETLISDTTGFVKYDVIHLTGVPATEKEKSEIQTLFSQGVLI